MTLRKSFLLAAALLAVLGVAVIDSHAQFHLPKNLPKIPGLDRIPGLDKLLGKEPPVTTSLADALTEVAFLDDFTPELALPLGAAPHTSDGDFKLRPGSYHYTAQTYCLHAGTHAPGRGEGYLYAPLRGQRGQIIRNILRHSVQHPEIKQHDIQVLIWSILARTKPTEMQPALQQVAAQLLTPKELFDLNGGALGVLPESVKQKALEQAPPALRAVLEAENRIRDLVTRTNATFADIERVAVLAGDPPVQSGDRTDLPRQRWSYHPAGYFVRFDPNGYPRTTVDVYVPEWFQIMRDDAGRITRLSDQYGNRIETTYAATRKSIAPDSLRGSEFVSVRFIDGLSGKTAGKWDKSGWLLSGPAGEGSEVAGETLRMTDVSSRVVVTKQRKAEFAKILDKKKSGALPQLLDLAAYYDAVSALAGKSAKVARYPNLVLRAWQAAFVQGGASRSIASSSMASASGASDDVSGGNADFDPSGNVAVPGQTGRQRLSQSSRCGEDCGCNHDGMCSDLNRALNAITSPAGSDPLSQQLAKLKKDFCDSPSSVKHIEQMQKDLEMTGQGEYGLYQLKTALNNLKMQAGCGTPEFECPLTMNSVMMCPHGGHVVCTPSDTNRAMPNGPQLKATDICTVVGCPFSINGQPSPCTRVQWIPTGGNLNLDCHSIGIVIGANGVAQGPVTIIP
ncbi:MAG: hypothetical protein M3041_01570 [Acidobacteriota bacterium]|nr:hypothetical protein [Acidobacteriota bacterium]